MQVYQLVRLAMCQGWILSHIAVVEFDSVYYINATSAPLEEVHHVPMTGRNIFHFFVYKLVRQSNVHRPAAFS